MHYRLEHDLGLKLASEAATKKWFPASNDAREVCKSVHASSLEPIRADIVHMFLI